MLNQYLKIIIVVIITVLILFTIFMISNKVEFAKVKVKTEKEIPGFVKQFFKVENETISQRGLYFYSDGNYPKGWFIVDVDKKTVKYSLKLVSPDTENNNGTLKLSDKQLNEIVSLVNKIWASESDFETERPSSAATTTFLVLIDKKEYRSFDTSLGSFGAEVGQLHRYLASLFSK